MGSPCTALITPAMWLTPNRRIIVAQSRGRRGEGPTMSQMSAPVAANT
jgi:hypothetical protein